MAVKEQDQEFIEYIVRSLVNHPEDVRTEREIDNKGIKITLSIHPEDMGYVIGRSGNTAKAIRTLLRTIAAKHDARIGFVIHEPEGSEHHRRSFEAEMGDLSI